MHKIKYDYSAIYVPQSNITVLHMLAITDDDMSDYTFAVTGDLNGFEIEQHRDFMRAMATDDKYKRKVEVHKPAEFK